MSGQGLTQGWHARSLGPADAHCPGVVWAGQRRAGWESVLTGLCPAGPGAAVHHRLPAQQQRHFRLVASLTQERWRAGEEEGPLPGPSLTRWSPLGAIRSLWFGLSGLAVLEPAQHSPAGPHGGHKAGAATVTSTGKDSFGGHGGGCGNSTWELMLPVWGRCPPGPGSGSARAQTWEQQLPRK